MPVWQVALVLNLTLAVGLGLGYAGWGRRVEALDREFDAARAQVERLERERAACGPGARAGEQQWEGRGVVRAIWRGDGGEMPRASVVQAQVEKLNEEKSPPPFPDDHVH